VPGTLYISLLDAYQGFARRSTDSLSGGESFLVSLALALALADIGKGLQVDTLFIDEGFGTLSGQPLTNAIRMLRTLHSQSGRHVGVISHVEEVKAHIPVQIQVNQEGNSSSSTVTVIS
jgi:exonuclease SbcC